MKFYGISKVFSTLNDGQYETIGRFWDELSEKYGRANLRGLGYHWMGHSIEYVIGRKEGIIEGYNCVVDLPDTGWITVNGRTENLGKLYDEIYKDGSLTYEIEMFSDSGDCQIQYYR
ncbi:MAG: hypothetical protein ACI3XG_01545 [Faecousia sp.]